MNGAVDIFVLSSTQTMSNTDTCTHRKTDKQIDDQIRDCAGCANCCDCNTATVAAHNDQVSSIEQKLQKAGENDGNSVGNNAGK